MWGTLHLSFANCSVAYYLGNLHLRHFLNCGLCVSFRTKYVAFLVTYWQTYVLFQSLTSFLCACYLQESTSVSISSWTALWSVFSNGLHCYRSRTPVWSVILGAKRNLYLCHFLFYSTAVRFPTPLSFPKLQFNCACGGGGEGGTCTSPVLFL